MLIRLNVFGESIHVLFFGGKAGVRDFAFALDAHFAGQQIKPPLIIGAYRTPPNDFVAKPDRRAMMRVVGKVEKVNGGDVAHFK
jgi:hypothetical protein